jgi:transposase
MGRARRRHRLGQLDVRQLGRRRARGGRGSHAPTPITTCELNDGDPPAWLAHILARPRDRPAKRRDKWPPWNWTPRQRATAEAA